MNLTKLVLLMMVILVASCGGNSDDVYEPASTYNASESYEDGEQPYAENYGSETVKPDGDYDCTATNISRGNGPYTLGCEKDGGDVTIHFNNGGHITVDEDGYDSYTGEHWDVELE